MRIENGGAIALAIENSGRNRGAHREGPQKLTILSNRVSKCEAFVQEIENTEIVTMKNQWTDLEVEAFRERLGQVIAWTERLSSGFDHGSDEYGLVFRQMNPVLDGVPLYRFEGGEATWVLDDFDPEIIARLLELAVAARDADAVRGPFRLGDLGRIIGFQTSISLTDGAPSLESKHFLDVMDVPPIDTWFFLKSDYFHGDHPCKQVLFCWIPKAFEAVMQQGIDVEILDSYRWMDENDPEAYQSIADGFGWKGEAPKSINSLLEHGYTCRPDPPYEGGIEGFIKELMELFSGYFDPGYVAQELALPDDFREFLEGMAGSYSRGNWAALFAMDDIYHTTKYQLRLWEPSPENPVLWIDVGNWSDKHHLVMCVSKSHPDFGKVIDAYDDHPYCSEDFYNYEEWESIHEYVMASN